MVPNTQSKIADKTTIHECKQEYTRDMLRQQLGVGVKFAAELLAMVTRMTLHVTPDNILIIIDLKHAYTAIGREAVIERHRGHRTMKKTVPY